MPGADRVAWRLVRKQGFLHWVLLWDGASVHRNSSLLGMDPYCSSGVPRALHSGWLHSGATASRHRDPAASEASNSRPCNSLPSPCAGNEAVLDFRLSTMKRLMAHWVLHACAEVEKNTSITTKARRHLSWTFEEAPRLAARATREHLDGTLFDETEVEHEEPPEEEDLILHDDDDDDGADNPESTGTAVAEASTAVADGSTAVAEASEPFPTVAAEVARAERLLYLRCAYGKHPPKP